MADKENIIQELQNKIGELTELVHRQSKIIQQTGQQVLEMQIRTSQDDFKKLDKDQGDGEPEFVTNDDIVQLVGELQGQLDFLELRSLRRTQNSTLSQPQAFLAPVPNNDGEFYPAFPKTYEEFEKLSNEDVLQICDFYDLIPPSKEQEAKLEKILKEGAVSQDKPLEAQLRDDIASREFTESEMNSLFDELSRFVGLKLRRTAGVW